MKKSLLFLLAFLLSGSLTLQAGPVPESRAREIAMKVLASQPATKAAAGDVKLIWDGEDAATKAAGNPAFYVYGSDRGGFVIIAGDDNVPPVLAISETNQFKVEGMPENVKWMMEGMKSYVRSASSPSAEVRSQWARFADTKVDPVAPDAPSLVEVAMHRTPEWNQGNADDYYFHQQVFNTKCPKDADGNLTMTGCVATAISELMTTLSGIYPAMPSSAVGTVEAYEPYGEYITAVTPYVFNTEYDWPGLRTLTGTDAINKAISDGKTDLLDNMAQLLADMGAMVRSSYSKDATAAYTVYAADYAPIHMGISKSVYSSYASGYSTRQWADKLKAELYYRPVLYSGTRSDGGHAFVLDGYAKYNGSDMFYVNFGWGGGANGYYLVTQFQGFTDYCATLFNFYPDPESASRRILIMYSDPYTPTYGIRYLENGRPSKAGDPVLIDKFCVKNKGTEDYVGRYRLIAVDKNGNWRQTFDENDYSFLLNYYTTFYYGEEDDLHLDHDPEFGEKIILQYTTDDEYKVWETVAGYQLSEATVVTELPLMPAAFIKTEAEYKLNDWFAFRLTNHDYVYDGTVWTITEPDGTVIDNLPQSQHLFILTQTGTYKIEAAVAPEVGEPVVETITTYITVSE